jgi:hypothetical protein
VGGGQGLGSDDGVQGCHDPGFYQILGKIFFVFVLLEMIEISQGFKNF